MSPSVTQGGHKIVLLAQWPEKWFSVWCHSNL